MAAPTITARIAFAGSALAETPTWSDVSTDVLDFATKRGRSFELDRFEAGDMTVRLKNTNKNYWPDNTGGAYSPNVLPGKRIDLAAVYGGGTYYLQTAFIESWQYEYQGGTKVPFATIKAVDGLKLIANHELQAFTRSQELSGTRGSAILDDVGWPTGAGYRDMDAGQSQIQAGTVTVKALDHLNTVLLSEMGILWQSGSMTMTFQDRHARLKSPYLTSQGTVGDGAGNLPFYSVEFENSDFRIINDVRLLRSGGGTATALDATSQDSFGKRGLSRTGLLLTADNELEDQADYIVGRYKDPVLRVKSITLRPGMAEATLYPQVLVRDISDRITINISSASINDDYHIESVSQRVVGKLWETKWELSPADAGGFLILDDPVYGKLDAAVARLAY